MLKRFISGSICSVFVYLASTSFGASKVLYQVEGTGESSGIGTMLGAMGGGDPFVFKLTVQEDEQQRYAMDYTYDYANHDYTSYDDDETKSVKSLSQTQLPARGYRYSNIQAQRQNPGSEAGTGESFAVRLIDILVESQGLTAQEADSIVAIEDYVTLTPEMMAEEAFEGSLAPQLLVYKNSAGEVVLSYFIGLAGFMSAPAQIVGSGGFIDQIKALTKPEDLHTHCRTERHTKSLSLDSPLQGAAAESASVTYKSLLSDFLSFLSQHPATTMYDDPKFDHALLSEAGLTSQLGATPSAGDVTQLQAVLDSEGVVLAADQKAALRQALTGLTTQAANRVLAAKLVIAQADNANSAAGRFKKATGVRQAKDFVSFVTALQLFDDVLASK